MCDEMRSFELATFCKLSLGSLYFVYNVLSPINKMWLTYKTKLQYVNKK